MRKINSKKYDLGGYTDLINKAGNTARTALSGGLSSTAGNIIGGLGDLTGAIPGPMGTIAKAGLNALSGIVNGVFGSQINEEAVHNVRNANAAQAGKTFDVNSNSDLLSANLSMLGSIGQNEIGKDGLASNKVKNLTAELNRQRDRANMAMLSNYSNAADNVFQNNKGITLSNYIAYGGPLTMRYTGPMSPFGNTFDKGGKIHIKPSKRGTFTAAAKKHGKSVQAFASQVLANKENYSPAMVKKANFARNSSKWKHAFGGNLLTNGAEWDNGLTIIGNGGTHEENPFEGVQMGIDAQGIPNLVEEGEVIFNDYVFSDRMKVPNNTRERLGLSKKDKNLTFAKAAKKLSKESEERPNDPISKNGLEHSLGILSYTQEDERFKKQMRNPEFRRQLMTQLSPQEQQYAHGGRLGKKYRGPGEYPNVLDTPDNTEPYAYWGNQGRNRVTNPKIAEGWDSFTWNSQPLYDAGNNTYNPLYTDIRFQNYVRQNYDQLSKDWWNESNAPDYYRAGNTSAPTIDQMLGNDITSTGLMYDKKYGEAHRFGQYALEKYMESLNSAPQLDPTKSITMSPMDIKPLDLPKAPKGSSKDSTEGDDLEPTWLRYAPLAGSAIGLGYELFNKPDYSSADAILDAANTVGNYTPVSYKPIGDYLTYNPLDRNYYSNKLGAQANATRRAIVNQSAGNRATAVAGLLAADYNAQGRLGDLARQAEEYNLGQRERVATFNRGTNQFNSEMGLKAAMANQEAALRARSQRLSGVAQAMQVRDAVDARRGASMSANLSNLFNSLGDIGKENYIRNMINSDKSNLYKTDRRGNYSYKGANGGLLTVRKKKGGSHA